DAVRRLTRAPALTLAVLGTLALTIGATATVYGVVHRVLLSPLPFPDPDRLVWLDHSGAGIGAPRGLNLTQGLYHHYRASSHTLRQIAVFTSIDKNVVADGEPERLEVTMATSSFGATTAAAPHLGRFFSDAEDVPGGPHVAVLSDGFWRRRFGGSAAVIGRTIAVDGVTHQIIGVMPRGFTYPSTETALWIPLGLDPASSSFGSFSLMGVGRLSPGTTAEDAQRELDALIPRVAESFPEAAGMGEKVKLHALVVPLRDHIVGDVQRTLWILLAAVGFVLLIAAANLMGLFIVRAESRQRELAVRVALGANKQTLFRHLFAESLLLSVTGGGLGLMLGWWALGVLRASGPADLPRREEIGMDLTLIIAATIVVAVVALIFTLPPLLQKPRVAMVLRESGRGLTSSRQRVRGRSVLVAGQVALAVVLMIGAGLMLQSFWRVRHVDPGFVSEQVMTFEVGLSQSAYETPGRAILAQQAILARLRALPGVENAGATSCLPFCGRWAGDGWIAEDRPLAPGEPPPVGATRVVSVGYLATLGVPLLAGRALTAADDDSPAPVVVISAQLAHRLWPGESAVGRRISNHPASSNVWYTVVGVVANTPIRDATEDPAPMVYLPLRADANGPGPWQMAMVVRTKGSPNALAGAIRREVRAVDATVAVARLRTMEDIVTSADARMALATILLGGAAAVALLLGVLGIYGVIAFVVNRRVPEFGLRLALGASRRDIVTMLLRQGSVMIGAGLAVGVVGALALSGAMRALLFGVSPADP
ncbi:MAG: ABC transporter permease, partial [Gemmatimonadaceae bacterium]